MNNSQFIEKYFSEETLTDEEIVNGINSLVQSGDIWEMNLEPLRKVALHLEKEGLIQLSEGLT